ncbi:MAG: LacI family DNA-binding transcriptional regulator [Victivallaceae bacterium]|nr:LacI family DNA-binding transcriptional regulator [Victivallaceae bacterium]
MQESKINIREIAQALHCSPSTVSRVLSGRDGMVKIGEKTRKRILDYCHTHDYHPSIHAVRFFSKRSRMIGFLCNDNLFHDDLNMAKSMFTVCRELAKRKYRCLPLLNTPAFLAKREYLSIFNSMEIDALIVWGAFGDCRYLEELREGGRPFLMLTNRCGDFPSVSVNQRKPAFELARHCRQQGAGKFAILNFSGGDSFRQRQEGFEEALAGCEIKFFPCEQNRFCGYELTGELLKYAPDAVLCGNDDTAIGVERGLLEHGVRIPEDMMLTGGDNLAGAEYCPVPISTFDQKAAECASCCVDMLLAHLEEGAELVSHVLDSAAIFRASTRTFRGKPASGVKKDA